LRRGVKKGREGGKRGVFYFSLGKTLITLGSGVSGPGGGLLGLAYPKGRILGPGRDVVPLQQNKETFLFVTCFSE